MYVFFIPLNGAYFKVILSISFKLFLVGIHTKHSTAVNDIMSNKLRKSANDCLRELSLYPNLSKSIILQFSLQTTPMTEYLHSTAQTMFLTSRS